jgi:hypothetical protein
LNDYLRKINDEYTKTLRNFKSLKITKNFRFPGYNVSYSIVPPHILAKKIVTKIARYNALYSMVPGTNATYSMVYNYTTRGNIPVKVNETGIMIGDDRVYTIRYIATSKQYDSSMQILQKMISSFKIDPIILRYEDPSLGVRINYPHNWTLVREFGPRDPLKRPHHNTVLDRTGSYSPGSNGNLIASIGFFSPIDGPYSVYKSYSMYINYDSAYTGHRNVAPYAVAIELNSQNRTWIKTIREWSLDGKQQRILYNDTKTYDKFFEKGKGYVHIDLNLNSLNIRKQFYLYFSVYDVFVNDGHICSLFDSTPFVSVPPPTYSIYINSSSPKIMVGDNETIPLYLKTSSPDLPFVVSFKPNKTADTNLEFKPPTLSGGASPILTTSNMQINVTKNAKPGIHPIPIYASIILTPSIGTNNSRSAIIHLFSNLTLNVEPPLTSGEIVKRFYTDWITPISGIWTFLAGVAATITPVIIFMYRRNRSYRQKH